MADKLNLWFSTGRLLLHEDAEKEDVGGGCWRICTANHEITYSGFPAGTLCTIKPMEQRRETGSQKGTDHLGQ